MDELIAAHRPDLIVIACNTASTIVLPDLRKRISLPFVGTVPAIKPACANSVSRHIAVLGTEATIAREYTRALIRDYAGAPLCASAGNGTTCAAPSIGSCGGKELRLPEISLPFEP